MFEAAVAEVRARVEVESTAKAECIAPETRPDFADDAHWVALAKSYGVRLPRRRDGCFNRPNGNLVETTRRVSSRVPSLVWRRKPGAVCEEQSNLAPAGLGLGCFSSWWPTEMASLAQPAWLNVATRPTACRDRSKRHFSCLWRAVSCPVESLGIPTLLTEQARASYSMNPKREDHES
jgi:hypothetical protein